MANCEEKTNCYIMSGGIGRVSRSGFNEIYCFSTEWMGYPAPTTHTKATGHAISN